MTEGYLGMGKDGCPVCHGWGTVREFYGPPHNPVPTGYEEPCDCRDELDPEDCLFDDPTVVESEYEEFLVEEEWRVPSPPVEIFEDEVAA